MKDRDAFFEEVNSYKLLAKKEVGQNFLIDSDAAERIVSLLDVQKDDVVLEIGCGAGSLTYFLSQVALRGDAIDIDEAMLAKCRNDFASSSLSILQGNAMRWDYGKYTKIVGNLPYYITSGILEKVLLGASNCSKMAIMVQKEAADRLLSPIGSKDYGPLNILLALSGTLKREFKVPRSSFSPAPHVDSAVLSYVYKDNRDLALLGKTYSLACSLFLQRRKTIANNLKSVVKDQTKATNILLGSNIDPSKRPEQLTPEEYLTLTKAIL